MRRRRADIRTAATLTIAFGCTIAASRDMLKFCVMDALIDMCRHEVLCDGGKSKIVSGCVGFLGVFLIGQVGQHQHRVRSVLYNMFGWLSDALHFAVR